MTKILWLAEALDDLREIKNYIARDNLAAAQRVVKTIKDEVEIPAQGGQEGCRQRENWLSLVTRTSWPIGKSTRRFKFWRWFTLHDCGRINCRSLKKPGSGGTVPWLRFRLIS